MANLVINTFCNLRCPYCFAEDEKTTYVNEEMTLETVKYATEFITQTEGRIGIIGGEPTFHRQFREIMYYLFDNPMVEQIVLYTNGTNLKKYKNILTHHKVRMLVNLNANGIISEEKLNEIVDVLKQINNENEILGFYDKISLGINIYSPKQEIDYIFQALNKLGLKGVRYSISIQQFDLENTPDPLDYYQEMKGKIIEFLDKCVKHRIVPNEDCNFIPYCILSEEEIVKYNDFFYDLAMEYGRNFKPIGINQNCYNGHPIDIHCDLTLSRCFGVSEHLKMKIHTFKDLTDVYNYYDRWLLSPAKMLNISSKCSNDCVNYFNCSGSCLKYKLKNIIDLRSKLGVV